MTSDLRICVELLLQLSEAEEDGDFESQEMLRDDFKYHKEYLSSKEKEVLKEIQLLFEEVK
jgi:hypothetical protein